LGVSRKDLGDCFFKLSRLFDPLPDRIHPIRGNPLDMLLTVEHEGERPDRVTLAVGAMAGGLAASRMGKRQRSRESSLGEFQAIQKMLDAAAEAGGLGALGREGRRIHSRCNITARTTKSQEESRKISWVHGSTRGVWWEVDLRLKPSAQAKMVIFP